MKKRLRRHKTTKSKKSSEEISDERKIPQTTIRAKKAIPKKAWSFLKRPKNNKIVFISFLFLIFSVLFFFLYIKSGKQKFNVSITDFNTVEYQESLRNDKPTSPLCGCLSELVPHDGIMIPAKYCKITNNQGGFALSNFLLTCPDQSKIGPIEGYSYDGKVYRFEDSRFGELSMAELCEYLNKDSLEKTYMQLNNNVFNSIITSKSIEVFSCLDQSVTAFIGSVKGFTVFSKNYDKFTGKVSSVEIRNKDSIFQNEELSKLPALDFNSKKVFIRWIDSFQLLTPHGDTWTDDTLLESMPQKIKKKEKELKARDVTVNVAVIEPKNNLRISILPWGEKYFSKWVSDYYSQFEKGRYLFFGHMPIIDRRTLALIPFGSFRPFRTPAISNNQSDVTLSFHELLDDSVYNKLYKQYSLQQGYSLQYDSNDFQLAGRTDITNAVKDTAAFINKLKYVQGTERLDAHELEKKMRELQSMIDTGKMQKMKGDTIMLNGGQEYFRYPPLHKENGSSFYVKFDAIKFKGCTGIVQVDGRQFPLHNQVLEIEDIVNIEYEYPALFSSFSDATKKFVLKGRGKIKIDAEPVKENFFEKRNVLILSTFTSILGFVITIIQLFLKKKPNNQQIS